MKRGWLIPLAGAAAALVGCVGYGYPGSGYGAGDPNPGYGSGYPSSGGGYYPSAPGYGSTVRCESNDGRVKRCDANTRGGVRLSKQISNTRCVQGSNWGYDNSGVWVSQGCRAEFVTGNGGYGPGQGNPGYGNGQVIRCESEDGRMRRCNVRVGRDVQVSRQLSNTRCIERRNWGWDRNGIWVNGGCRAEFSVY